MRKPKVKNIPPKQAHSGNGFVRIIAGKWRGKKLAVKDVQGLRPTSDRVKETLFNWLQTDINQARCLDLFAGSGSLGFEALSRHAACVTFVEKNLDAYQQLSNNLQQLGVENALIKHTDALDFLEENKNPISPFNLVFIDPPFHQGLLPHIINKINSDNLLSSSALIYVETELEKLDLPSNWRMLKEKKAGQVYFRLYRKEE